MALNLTPEEEAEERELYASLYPKKSMPSAGIGYNPDTGEATRPEQQGLLDQSREESEEEDEDSYPSPLAMGLLAAGASMMRQSGWRDTPITTEEQLGYAIPAGMQGYYQQDMLNQQEQAAVAEADKEAATAQADADNLQSFHAAVLDAPGLNDAQKNNIIAMSKLGKEGIKKAMDRFTDLQTKKEEWSEPYINPLQPSKALIKNKKTGKVEVAFDLPDMSDWRDLEFKDEDGVMRMYRVSPDGDTKIMLGETGKVSGREQFKYQQARDVLSDGQFEMQFGLSKEQFENLKENQMRNYDFKFEVDKRDFLYAVEKFEDEMAEKVKAGDLKQAQADRAIVEFDKQFKFQQEKWGWTKEHTEEKWGWTKEQAVQEQENWDKQFEEKKNESKANRDQRVKEHAHTIVQDGIRNGFSREQIDNQLSQFEKRFEAEGVRSDRTFNRGVLEFGINNDHRIKDTEIALERFAYLKVRDTVADREWLTEHDLKLKRGDITDAQWLEEMSRKKERDKVGDEQWRINLDERLKENRITHEEWREEIERRKGRDIVGDEQWQKTIDLQWEKHKQAIQAEADAHGIKLENLDLAKLKFTADVEHRMWEKDYKMNVVPRTLIGEDAKEWARANKVKFDTGKGQLIVQLDKHGNLKGSPEESISYHKLQKLNKEQRGYVRQISQDWHTSVEVKQANKVAVMLKTLETLGEGENGVREFAMIYKFMKSLDPTSTVLASEFKNAATAGLGWATSLKQWGQKGIFGTQLQPEIKADIIEGVRRIARMHWEALDGAGLGNKRITALQTAELMGIDNNTASPIFRTGLDDIFKKKEPEPEPEVEPEKRKANKVKIDQFYPKG